MTYLNSLWFRIKWIVVYSTVHLFYPDRGYDLEITHLWYTKHFSIPRPIIPIGEKVRHKKYGLTGTAEKKLYQIEIENIGVRWDPSDKGVLYYWNLRSDLEM